MDKVNFCNKCQLERINNRAEGSLYFCTSVVVPYCSCCLYLYFGSSIMLVTYFLNFR